jgi:hypothetical protein
MCPQCAPPRCMPRYIAGQQPVRGVSRPVGRVLCARLRGAAVIHLGLPLPAASCGPPASIGRAALDRSRRETRSPLDLAPGGVYRAAAVTCGAGGLLHRRFTLTPALPRRRSVFCGTVPRVTPGRRYRPPCPVEPGPSSPGTRPGATARPAHPGTGYAVGRRCWARYAPGQATGFCCDGRLTSAGPEAGSCCKASRAAGMAAARGGAKARAAARQANGRTGSR